MEAEIESNLPKVLFCLLVISSKLLARAWLGFSLSEHLNTTVLEKQKLQVMKMKIFMKSMEVILGSD